MAKPKLPKKSNNDVKETVPVTTSPTPSLRTIPLAPASNGLHRPSGLNAPAFENEIVTDGERIRFAPPASARRVSPAHRLRQARCTAVSDEEHAVSSAMLGPCRPRANEMRPAAALSELPLPK